LNKNCPGATKEDLSKEETKDRVKIVIDMDSKGTYSIKEWHDPNMDYELDGMILEIFKDDKGQLKMVSWTEEELYDIQREMLTFWDDDEFWDQVVIGYTGGDGALEEFNLYDDAMKKWRKNKHQQGTAEKEKGKKKKSKREKDLAKVTYEGYEKGNGKCRKPDGTFQEGDSFWAGGPNDPMDTNRQNVNSMAKCKRRCTKDPKCLSFHYYLLDPWGVTNCWIWTKEGYQSNGSEKAYCFVKTGATTNDAEELEDTDDTTFGVAVDNDRKVPDKSMQDWDKQYAEWKEQNKNTTQPAETEKSSDEDYYKKNNEKPCFTYRETKGCVMGKNMKKLRDVSFE